MKKTLSVVFAGILVACSSSGDASAPACTIAGTYDNTATIDPSSEVGCMNLPATAKNTLTLTRLDDTSYDIGFTGLVGSCPATVTETCKLTARCDLTVASPTTAATTGTYQAALTFNATGLTNSVAVSLPPNTTYTSGCSYRATSVGTRL